MARSVKDLRVLTTASRITAGHSSIGRTPGHPEPTRLCSCRHPPIPNCPPCCWHEHNDILNVFLAVHIPRTSTIFALELPIRNLFVATITTAGINSAFLLITIGIPINARQELFCSQPSRRRTNPDNSSREERGEVKKTRNPEAMKRSQIHSAMKNPLENLIE